MGKKILLQFPIGKHSLSSLDIQQWGTDGQRLGKVRWWILHAPQPVVCDEVAPLREVLSLYPTRCCLRLRFETGIDVVWRGAKPGRLKSMKEPHDDEGKGKNSEKDAPILKGWSHS